tara:strand:- start:101 stop:202 length:102 start_codon:yes stop_codon:yes gene_type:complete
MEAHLAFKNAGVINQCVEPAELCVNGSEQSHDL